MSTVRIRLADNTTLDLPGDTGATTAGRVFVRVGAVVRTVESPHPRPLGEDPASMAQYGIGWSSARGVLCTYLPGSVVRIHREDARRTAYVAEVIDNADPIDHAGDSVWDVAARSDYAPVRHDLLATGPE